MGAVMSVLNRYNALRGHVMNLIGRLFARLALRMGGWPPDPRWMRAYGPWILASLAVPVMISARRVLLSSQKNSKNNTLLDDFVKKELNRRLVSLREILAEEEARIERKHLKDAKAAESERDPEGCAIKGNTSGVDVNGAGDMVVVDDKASSVAGSRQAGGDTSGASDDMEEIMTLAHGEVSDDDFDSNDDEDEELGRYHGRDEDTPIKVSDIVSAVNQVSQMDRRAPEVADGWVLAATAMARELPEAVAKTRNGTEEEWRNGDKLRDLYHRARRLELVLDATARGYWKRITNPWGGVKTAYFKDAHAKRRLLNGATLFKEAQEEARLLLEQRDKTQLGKGLALLWQYKQEIPLMAVSTFFMMLEGAVSAFPHHYQAALVSVVTGRFMTSLSGGGTTLSGSAVAGHVGTTSSLVDVLVSLLVSHCCSSLIRLLAEKISSISNRRIGLKMQVDVYHSILQQDIEYWDVHDTDEAFETLWISADCVDEIMRFPNDILQTLSQVMSTGFILYAKNPRLLGIMLLLSPAQMLIQHYIGCLDAFVYRQAWKKNINSRSDWGEVLDPKNFRTVRSFVREPREVQMFSRELEQETETKATTSAIRLLFEPVQNIVSQTSELLGLYFGGSMVMAGTLQAGDLVSFINMAQGLSWTLRQLIHVKDELYESLDPAGRVYDLLSHKPKIGLYGGLKPDDTKGALSFEGVEFAYPSRPEVKVLRGTTFSVEGGTMCALVGPSGSGKSTVLSLVERFYDPSVGRITLDGIDIKDLDPCWLRSQMAIVSQEPVLFSVSIRENLIYGCEDEPSQETIEQACRDANIYDFIVKKCPNKWRTQVGEGGSEISVGQKQRIAIARALLKNPKILLLDEATSALDSESEVLVQQALDRLMVNRTTLVVAHRLSTIRDANKIVAIKNGCVHEQGNHTELLAKKGLYYSYVRKQRLLRFGQSGSEMADVGEEMDLLDAKEEAVTREVEVVTAAAREVGAAMGQGEFTDKISQNVDKDSTAQDGSRGKKNSFLSRKELPMLSPVTEVEGSPTYLPSEATKGRISPMDLVSLGASATSSVNSVSSNLKEVSANEGGSVVTIFRLAPYEPKENKEIPIMNGGSISAPPTPVRSSSVHKSKNRMPNSTIAPSKENFSRKFSRLSENKQRAARFYRTTLQLKKRFENLMQQSAESQKEIDKEGFTEIVHDFGDILKLFAPSKIRKRSKTGRKNAESAYPSRKQMRPTNSMRPLIRQRSTPTPRGRSTGWRSAENTPDRASRKRGKLGSRYGGGFSGDEDMSASAYGSSDDDMDGVLAPVPLRQTLSFGV